MSTATPNAYTTAANTDTATDTTTTDTDPKDTTDMTTTDTTTTDTVTDVSPALAAIRIAMAPLAAANIARIATIDVEAGKVAGTFAAKVKAATEDVTSKAVASGDASHPVLVLRSLSDQIAELEAQAAEATEAVSGLVNAYLKATSAGSDDVATLRTERDALVTSTNAMAVVMGSDVSIPKAPRILGGKGIKTIGGTVTKTVGAHYVVEADGSHTVFSKDTLAYIAFAYGVNIVDLKCALSDAGVSSLTETFEATVTLTAAKKGGRTKAGIVNTFTVGLVAKGADADTADADK